MRRSAKYGLTGATVAVALGCATAIATPANGATVTSVVDGQSQHIRTNAHNLSIAPKPAGPAHIATLPPPSGTSRSAAPTTTTPATTSSLPNPRNAGVIAGTTLTTHTGNYSITSSANISALHITGSLFITGSNVTVSNVQVDGAVQINRSPTGGIMSPVPSNITLSHVATTGVFTVGFNGLTLSAVNVSNARNAPHAQIYCYYDSNKRLMYPASNFVLKNSWFHGFLPSTNSAHLENLHLGCVHGATITNNEFDLFSPDGNNTLSHFTANLTLDAELFGAWNSNVTIQNNVLKGGSYYQLYYCSSGSNNDVSGNSFSSSNDPIFAGVQFPPSQYSSASLPNGTYTKFTQSGNVLNGTATSLPGGK